VSLYVYAVLDEAGPRPRLPRIRYLGCGAVSAAVRAVRRAPLPRPAAMRRHARVVHDLWAGAPAVLPVRFGTVFADEEALCREISPRAAGLRSALDRVRGRAQVTIRVLAPARARTTAPPPASGREFLARRAAWWRGADVPGLPGLLRALRPLRAAERIERHEAPPFTASVHHLVDRVRLGEYRRALARGRGPLPLRVNGPWPPYAFAAEVGA
jgi:hypothetical protein